MRQFLFTLLKTFNPKYYTTIVDIKLGKAFKFFCHSLVFFFILMLLISIPRFFFLSSEIEKNMLDVADLKIDSTFKTAKKISFPSDDPFISFDTSGDSALETEVALVTEKQIYYKLFGNTEIIPLDGFDFNSNRAFSKQLIFKAIIFILPSIFFYYYIAWFVKYLLIILPISYIAFIFVRKKLTIKQTLSLGFLTSTVMLSIEILTLPFFITKYLVTLIPLPGLHISLIAVTAYLALFISALRLNTYQPK